MAAFGAAILAAIKVIAKGRRIGHIAVVPGQRLGLWIVWLVAVRVGVLHGRRDSANRPAAKADP